MPSDDEASDQVDALQEVQRVLLHPVGGGIGSRQSEQVAQEMPLAIRA